MIPLLLYLGTLFSPPIRKWYLDGIPAPALHLEWKLSFHFKSAARIFHPIHSFELQKISHSRSWLPALMVCAAVADRHSWNYQRCLGLIDKWLDTLGMSTVWYFCWYQPARSTPRFDHALMNAEYDEVEPCNQPWPGATLAGGFRTNVSSFVARCQATHAQYRKWSRVAILDDRIVVNNNFNKE